MQRNRCIEDLLEQRLLIVRRHGHRAEVVQTLHRDEFCRQRLTTLGLGRPGLIHGLAQSRFRPFRFRYIPRDRHRSEDVALGSCAQEWR